MQTFAVELQTCPPLQSLSVRCAIHGDAMTFNPEKWTSDFQWTVDANEYHCYNGQPPLKVLAVVL